MKLPFNTGNKSTVIDITQDFVHIIEVSGSIHNKGVKRKDNQSRPNVQVTAMGSEWFAAGCVSSSGVIVDPEPIQEALKKLLGRLHMKPKSAGIIIPSSQSITKIISLPSDMNTRQIEEQIIADSSRYIPYPIDDVDFDFFVMGKNQDVEDHQRVMVAACKKETVESYVAILEDNGIKPSVIDVRSLAIKLALENVADRVSEFIVSIECGYYVTSIQAYHGDDMVYSRNHNFGLNSLIHDIENTKNISRDDVLYTLKSNKFDDKGIQDIIESHVETIVRSEVVSMVNFFRSTVNDIGDESIFIFGIGADLPGFRDAMERALHTTILLCNPLSKQTIPVVSSKNAGLFDRSALLPSYGLAIRGYL